MDYEITVEDIPKIQVASLRYKGSVSDNLKYGLEVYMECRKVKCGPPISLYYDKERLDVMDIECCMPISEPIESKKLQCKTLPAVRAICTTHYGSYDTIGNGYFALINFAKMNNLNIQFPTRLVFEAIPKSLVKINHNKIITKIVFPIK
ncbi:MAG: GyrI-like domain-containing protein [Eubacterium sp.]|nr:GyrI-like domain-containing protein [Eubacterium sp.]